MKASDLFVKCLEEEQVEYIFGLPGEETNDLIISLAGSPKIKFILTRHEQGAAFMADVYGRLTQKVGVCLSTLGPGATNLTTGVANANMDRSPLLAITGQTYTDQLHKESHQNMDPITMFEPITKWRWSMRNADSIPEIIRRAFKIALEEKGGAVHLELPQDVAKMESDIKTIGIKEADYALTALKKADLVIAIGYDLVEYSPKNWNGKLKKNIIHIDFTTAEVDTYYPPAIEIAADIEYTIKAILDELEEEKRNNPSLEGFPHKETPDLFKKIKKEVTWRIEHFRNDFSYPIKPEKLITDVRNILDEHDIVISDVGAHKLWIAKVYNTYVPNTCLITNGFCSMGFALPGAISAQLVKPKQKVVAMCGDGSFLMNVQEIETAVRLNLPIIIVVLLVCTQQQFIYLI